MLDLFAVCVLLSLLAVILSIINPKWVMRWKESPSRLESLGLSFGALSVSFIAFGITSDSIEKNENETGEPEPTEQVAEKIPESADAQAPEILPETAANPPPDTPIEASTPDVKEAPPKTSTPKKRPKPTYTATPPPSDLPLITQEGGLGDSAFMFHKMHRIDTRVVKAQFDEEGTTLVTPVYDKGWLVISSIRNVIQSITIRWDVVRDSRWTLKAGLAKAMRHIPTDSTPVRTFPSWQGHVSVFHSKSLAQHFPDPVWYMCQPVGTFQVTINQIEGESKYFNATISTGVDDYGEDPGRIEC